jgi:hypothetical protein
VLGLAGRKSIYSLVCWINQLYVHRELPEKKCMEASNKQRERGVEVLV